MPPPPSSSTNDDIRKWQQSYNAGSLSWQQRLDTHLDAQDQRMAEYHTRMEERHSEQMR
ncbi:hypothetical protein LINGRAHAP2_LOCUS4687 [Linum grandiflorum]